MKWQSRSRISFPGRAGLAGRDGEMAKPARVPYPTSSSKRVNPTKQPHLWHQLQQLPEGHIAQQAR